MEQLIIVPKKNSLKTSFPDPSLPPPSSPPWIPERTWRFIAGVGGLLQVWVEECEPGGGVVMVEGGGVCWGAWEVRAWRRTVVEVEG